MPHRKLTSTSILAAIALLAEKEAASAFTFPTRQSTRTISKLDATTLDDWQLLDNGSVVGSVKGHPNLNDGDIITTSPLADPSNAQTGGSVTTLTGSQYDLGSPMQLKRNSASSTAAAEPGTMDRGSLLTTVGIGSLVAGGFALGVGVGSNNIGSTPQMTRGNVSVPERTTQARSMSRRISRRNQQGR